MNMSKQAPVLAVACHRRDGLRRSEDDRPKEQTMEVKTMKDGIFFFVVVALCAACIGAASGLVLADFIAAASLVWAWVIHAMEGKDND